MSGVFQSVRSASPGRSVFNLSYEKKFTCDMGQLIPVMCDEMVPGDKFNIGNQMIIRFQPLVALYFTKLMFSCIISLYPIDFFGLIGKNLLLAVRTVLSLLHFLDGRQRPMPLDPFGIIWECLLESLPQTVYLLTFQSVPIILFGIVSIGMRLSKQLLTLILQILFSAVHGKRTILLHHCPGSSGASLLLFRYLV